MLRAPFSLRKTDTAFHFYLWILDFIATSTPICTEDGAEATLGMRRASRGDGAGAWTLRAH